MRRMLGTLPLSSAPLDCHPSECRRFADSPGPLPHTPAAHRPAALLAPRPRAMAHALQLTDVVHGEQKGWRRHQHLVDALPYVDGLTPAEKQAVDKLIEEEVRPIGPWAPQERARSAPGCRRRRRCPLPLRRHAAAVRPADAQQQQEAVRLPGRAAAAAGDAVQGAGSGGAAARAGAVSCRPPLPSLHAPTALSPLPASPPLPLRQGNELLEREMARVAAGEGLQVRDAAPPLRRCHCALLAVHPALLRRDPRPACTPPHSPLPCLPPATSGHGHGALQSGPAARVAARRLRRVARRAGERSRPAGAPVLAPHQPGAAAQVWARHVAHAQRGPGPPTWRACRTSWQACAARCAARAAGRAAAAAPAAAGPAAAAPAATPAAAAARGSAGMPLPCLSHPFTPPPSTSHRRLTT